MNESKPLMTRRNPLNDIKTRREWKSGISSEATYLLSERCPALRWHDFIVGIYMEHGNLRLQCKLKSSSSHTARTKVKMCNQGAEQLVVAMSLEKSRGAKGLCYSVRVVSQPLGRS
jgi:hypothetical protein